MAMPARPNIEIGARVKERRKELDLSLRDFARFAGVDYNILHRLERGYEISASTLIKICTVYKIPIIAPGPPGGRDREKG